MVSQYVDPGSDGLVSRLWGMAGPKSLIPFDRAEDLWKFLKYTMVSELATKLTYKFYKILTDQQVSLDPISC